MIESVKTDLNVMINNQVVCGLVSFEAEENVSKRKLREFLSDKPWAVVNEEKTYMLTLEYYASVEMIYYDNFTLTVEKDNAEVTYNRCFIKDSKLSYKNGKQTLILVIQSNEKE